MRILVEGGHLARGEIATLCAANALPCAQILILACDHKNSTLKLHNAKVLDANLQNYYQKFEELVSQEFDLVIPCTMRGLILANNSFPQTSVIAEPSLRHLSDFNKLSLNEKYLANMRSSNLLISNWSDADGAVILAKPIAGHSSVGHIRVTSNEIFLELQEREEFIFEKVFGDYCPQFSVSIYDGISRSTMCIERVKQLDGHTVAARRVADERVLNFCDQLAKTVPVSKVVNIQFALTETGCKVYDINPRFGFSELYRTCFGKNFLSEILGFPQTPLVTNDFLSEYDAWSILRSSAIQRNK